MITIILPDEPGKSRASLIEANLDRCIQKSVQIVIRPAKSKLVVPTICSRTGTGVDRRVTLVP